MTVKELYDIAVLDNCENMELVIAYHNDKHEVEWIDPVEHITLPYDDEGEVRIDV